PLTIVKFSDSSPWPKTLLSGPPVTALRYLPRRTTSGKNRQPQVGVHSLDFSLNRHNLLYFIFEYMRPPLMADLRAPSSVSEKPTGMENHLYSAPSTNIHRGRVSRHKGRLPLHPTDCRATGPPSSSAISEIQRQRRQRRLFHGR
ncbi:Unknown protein, partial [Striga hermonthica]